MNSHRVVRTDKNEFQNVKFQQKYSVEFDRGKFDKPGQNVASLLALFMCINAA